MKLPNQKKGPALGVLLILLSALLWGLLPLFSRTLTARGLDALSVGAGRAYVAALAYGVYGLFRGTFREFTWRDLPYYALLGLVTINCLYGTYLPSIDRVGSAMACVLMYTAPAFVILFSRLFYKERITPIKLCSLLCTFGGCILVVRLYDPAAFTPDLPGILLGLGAGVAYSMVTVLGRRGLRFHTPTYNATMSALFGALFFFVLRPPWAFDWSGVNSLLLLGIGTLCTVVPLIAYYKGMTLGIDGGTASLLATLEPVIAALVGIFFFEDLLSWPQLVGMALVLGGACLPVFARPTSSSERK